jgi:hypothetical protein
MGSREAALPASRRLLGGEVEARERRIDRHYCADTTSGISLSRRRDVRMVWIAAAPKSAHVRIFRTPEREFQ